MAKRAAAEKDAECLGAEIAFRDVFKPVSPKFFSGIARRYVGLSDRPIGVQWSVWHNHVDHVVELAVNLEGMEHDDWPIGRLIDRELQRPALPSAAAAVPLKDDVRVAWLRDAWATYKVPIAEDTILDMPSQALTADRWREALIEARACLTSDLKGRAKQKVTLPVKGRTELEVSPHLQLLTPVWRTMPNGHAERVVVMREARERLYALHGSSSPRVAASETLARLLCQVA